MPTKEFDALKQCISDAIAREIIPVRLLLECSTDSIHSRLLWLEKRLREFPVADQSGKIRRRRKSHSFKKTAANAGNKVLWCSRACIFLDLDGNLFNQVPSENEERPEDLDVHSATKKFVAEDTHLNITVLRRPEGCSYEQNTAPTPADVKSGLALPLQLTLPVDSRGRLACPSPSPARSPRTSSDCNCESAIALSPADGAHDGAGKGPPRRAARLETARSIRVASIFLSSRRPSAIYAQRDVASKIPLLCRGAGRLLPCLDAPLRRALDAVFGISDPNIWVRPVQPSTLCSLHTGGVRPVPIHPCLPSPPLPSPPRPCRAIPSRPALPYPACPALPFPFLSFHSIPALPRPAPPGRAPASLATHTPRTYTKHIRMPYISKMQNHSVRARSGIVLHNTRRPCLIHFEVDDSGRLRKARSGAALRGVRGRAASNVSISISISISIYLSIYFLSLPIATFLLISVACFLRLSRNVLTVTRNAAGELGADWALKFESVR